MVRTDLIQDFLGRPFNLTA